MTDRTPPTLVALPDHPPLYVWEEELFVHGAVITNALLTHLQQCPACAQVVTRLTAWQAVTRPAEPVVSGIPHGDALRDRIFTSRAQGVRTIVPAEPRPTAPDAFPQETPYGADVASYTVTPMAARAAAASATDAPAPWWRRSPVRAAAVVLASLGVASVMRQPPAAEAGMVAGDLNVTPIYAKRGDTVRVTYRSAGLLGKPPLLRLRARIRTATADSYNDGVPVVTMAMLPRAADGRYVGQFVLPDSVVFAALAVEDTAATAYDDRGGRAWEVLRAGADGRPLLDALEQRGNDLMGRSWEENLVTAREQVRLYPDSVRAWSYLDFMEGAMGLATDSTRAVHAHQAARFSARMLDGTLPMQAGRLFWYSRSTKDSALAEQWRARLLRDTPRDGFAVQERAAEIFRTHWASKDSAAALSALEALWADTPAERKAQVIQVASAFIGNASAQSVLMQRWMQRYASVDSSSYRRQWIARQYARIPVLRDSAAARLAALATHLQTAYERDRGLTETRTQFQQRILGERALTEAMLGSVLATNGQAGEALRRLRALPDVGWNVEVFEAMATAATAAGDTALALPQWARLVLDPRTSPAQVARYDSLGVRVVGDNAWRALKARTTTEMARAVMLRERRRRVEPATVVSATGARVALTELHKGRPAVMIFWSPKCGPAVEALPDFRRMAARLEALGVAVVMIAEQPGPDSLLTATLAKAGYTAPVYFDAGREANRAFSNWGTPQLYVMDRDGRVVFDPTAGAGETELRVKALLASAPKAAAQEPNR